MTLALSKYYKQEDYAELEEELAVVDACFTREAPQSEHRRWEYAMALRASTVWAQQDYEHHGHANRTHGGSVVDVGGSGSPFWHMLDDSLGRPIRVVDPHEPNGRTLEQHIRYASLASQVFCLSVLEHVEDLDQFLYHLSCLVAPGGLLFLTFDCCGCRTHAPAADPHHFSGMRRRIFTPELSMDIRHRLLHEYHFAPVGVSDFFNYQAQLYGGATDPGYSFASLALVKRR